MTTEDFEKLKSLRDDLKALLNDPKILDLKQKIADLEDKCDHTFPDGEDAWRVSWAGCCHDSECLICKLYEAG